MQKLLRIVRLKLKKLYKATLQLQLMRVIYKIYLILYKNLLMVVKLSLNLMQVLKKTFYRLQNVMYYMGVRQEVGRALAYLLILFGIATILIIEVFS